MVPILIKLCNRQTSSINFRITIVLNQSICHSKFFSLQTNTIKIQTKYTPIQQRLSIILHISTGFTHFGQQRAKTCSNVFDHQKGISKCVKKSLCETIFRVKMAATVQPLTWRARIGNHLHRFYVSCVYRSCPNFNGCWNKHSWSW